MMKSFAKITAILLSLLFVTAAFCGCDGGESDGTTAVSAEITTSAPETDVTEGPQSVTIVKDGVPCFNVIRSEYASDAETDAAKLVYQYFKGKYPTANILLSTDFSKDGKYDSETVEILVGKTGHPEAKAVLEDSGYGEGIIRVVGNKIVINSWQPTILATLVGELTAAAEKKIAKDPANVTFTDSDNYSQTLNKTLRELPFNTAKYPDNVVSVGDGATELVFAASTDDDLLAYAEKIRAAGFTEAQSLKSGINSFYTFVNGNACVTLSLTPYNKLMRVICEPVKNYYNIENNYKPTVKPLLTMIGRKFSAETNTYLGLPANKGLMCFVIRLSDGRFIVIDGGTLDGSFQSYAQAIYAKMREQAPDPDHIVIAAWIITHSHSDHIGGLYSFSGTYNKMVTLNSIIYDFPSDADHNAQSDESVDYDRMKAILGNFPKTPSFKAHTGQQLEISDAKITFWYTQEDYVTKVSTLGANGNKNWNNSSLAFSVDIAGERIFFLGDCQDYANNLMANCFGEALKSDFVQIAHHGGIGGTEAIYRAIDAEIGLFTTTDVQVPNYISKWAYNNYAVNKLHMKEYWNADERITTWELPYHAQGSGFIQKSGTIKN